MVWAAFSHDHQTPLYFFNGPSTWRPTSKSCRPTLFRSSSSIPACRPSSRIMQGQALVREWTKMPQAYFQRLF